MDINNKIAIVTGASSGLGASFSQILVNNGATVYGLARSEDKLKKVLDKLGDNFKPIKLDMTEQSAIDRWIDDTFHEDHSPDILINNAGVGYFGEVEDLKVSEWETMIDTNLNGVFYITRKVVPLMKKSELHNHIINIASIAGTMGNPKLSGYNATKYGLRGFSDALFKELRYEDIKVTCMLPGSIRTSFFENIDINTHQNMMSADEVADLLLYILNTSDNFLINEITLRPLNPKEPEE